MSARVEITTPEGSAPVALIRLDDGKANALNPASVEALHAALDEVERQGVSALVLTGRPGMFSAGLDLKLLPRLSTEDKRKVFQRFGELLLRIFTFRGPTVAAVTGHAIAGGALLALSTDTRLGVDLPARFGVTEVAVGLPVPNFGLLMARAALTPRELTELVLFAQVHSFRDTPVFRALYPEDALIDRAMALAGELGRLPSGAFTATKRALWQDDLTAIQAGMTAEVARFVDLFEARFPADAGK